MEFYIKMATKISMSERKFKNYLISQKAVSKSLDERAIQDFNNSARNYGIKPEIPYKTLK